MVDKSLIVSGCQRFEWRLYVRMSGFTLAELGRILTDTSPTQTSAPHGRTGMSFSPSYFSVLMFIYGESY